MRLIGWPFSWTRRTRIAVGRFAAIWKKNQAEKDIRVVSINNI
jgi:hypothetical protein